MTDTKPTDHYLPDAAYDELVNALASLDTDPVNPHERRDRIVSCLFLADVCPASIHPDNVLANAEPADRAAAERYRRMIEENQRATELLTGQRTATAYMGSDAFAALVDELENLDRDPEQPTPDLRSDIKEALGEIGGVWPEWIKDAA